jgi:hypothetical protein
MPSKAYNSLTMQELPSYNLTREQLDSLLEKMKSYGATFHYAHYSLNKAKYSQAMSESKIFGETDLPEIIYVFNIYYYLPNNASFSLKLDYYGAHITAINLNDESTQSLRKTIDEILRKSKTNYHFYLSLLEAMTKIGKFVWPILFVSMLPPLIKAIIGNNLIALILFALIEIAYIWLYFNNPYEYIYNKYPYCIIFTRYKNYNLFQSKMNSIMGVCEIFAIVILIIISSLLFYFTIF